MKKTNAIRLLEASTISFETKEYSWNEEELDAVSVAKKIGAEPERVFKTLVARTEKNEIIVLIIPGNFDLDLKKAATAAKTKKVELIKVKELLPLTGYVRGGCSPIGMKKHYRTFLDETAQLFEAIYVSAGIRGTQIFLAPDDLLDSTEANYAELC